MATTDHRHGTLFSPTGVRTCAALSLFMMVATLLGNPRPANIDSDAKIELVHQDLEKMTREIGASVPFMVTFRRLEDGSLWQSAHIPHYWVRKLHFGALPTLAWLGLAPLQVSPTFRKCYPRLHRRLGYLFFAAALSLAVGLTLLVSTGKVLGHPYWLAMAGNLFKLCYFVISMVQAYRCALSRQFALHQRWIARHLTVGYSVSMQRVLLFVVGPILHASGVLGGTDWTPKDMQAYYNATGFVATFIPMAYVEEYCLGTFRKSPPQEEKKNID